MSSREKIIDAAIDVFAETGRVARREPFHRPRVDVVAPRASVVTLQPPLWDERDADVEQAAVPVE